MPSATGCSLASGIEYATTIWPHQGQLEVHGRLQLEQQLPRVPLYGDAFSDDEQCEFLIK